MKKGMTLVVVIALVAILAVGAYLYFSNPVYTNSNANPPANSSPQTTPPANTGASNPASPSSHDIAIMNFAFSPSSLTIQKGDTVVWTNQDTVSHAVVSDSGSELGSSLLSQGQTYSHTFGTAGTYNYHCSVHTSMTGTIIVQ